MTGDEPLTLDAIGYIRTALANREMREMARHTLAYLISHGDLLAHQERKVEIRPSSFGSCTLALAAQFRGLEDLPRDPVDDQLARLDLGSLVGAWEACLLKAAMELERPRRWWAHLEFEPADGGHIDALCFPLRNGEIDGGEIDHTRRPVPVEFKSTYSTGVIPPPEKENRAHLLQLGDYANRHDVNAEKMLLVYIKAPAKAGERMRQFERDAAPWRQLVIEERARLAPALDLEGPLPVADPQAGYSCYTCLYGACSRNKNKIANSPEMLLA